MSDSGLTKEAFALSLQRNETILPGERIFVACSGGPDSAALFHLLVTLKKEWRLKLGLVHFNHGLRPNAARRDEAFVKNLARKYRVPFYAGRLKVKPFARQEKFSVEEAARLARYDFFKKTAKKLKIQKIATAHTLNDQAETVLMRALQGTGLKGLCGIRPSLTMGPLCMVRPFLNFTKKEILNYLKTERIKYCSDRTNTSDVYLRNRLRLKIMPALERMVHPKVQTALARIPAILSEDAQLIEDFADRAWRQTALGAGKKSIRLRRKKFMALPPPLQFRVIDRALRRVDPKSGLSFEAWQRLRLCLGRSRYVCSLPKEIDLAVTPSIINIYKR